LSFIPCTSWTTTIMAKVTIVRPPLLVPMWSDSGPLTPPIGPAYLAASLRHAGHTARIVPLIATGS